MSLFLTLRVALRALIRNKVRSILTMLGIIIGIAAVIAVIAVGQGATVMIQEQIASMGDNPLIIFPGSARVGGFRFGAGTRSTLTVQDAEAIIKECPYVKAVTPIIRAGGQIIYQDKNWSSGIEGVAPSYLEVRNWNLKEGNLFTDSDVKSATKVCLLGATVAKELFDNEESVGKTIRIRNMPFRVIGVLEKKGSAAFGHDQDNTIIAPWSTVSRVLQRSSFNEVNQILASVTSIKMLEPAKKEISAILRQRHRLSQGTEDDFSITDATEITNAITSISRLMTLLLVVIASISLIVGGIGIMNIMLVSVTERTREIGLRMAVGARGKDILLQFLVEAVVLAGIGGVFGIFLGYGAAQIISNANNWPVLVSTDSILLAFVFSSVVGIFFGFYPAWRASRLNPIEALRYE
ncbi:MAG: ABC transporter permease [Planctomycetota bacterium]|nr:ABC transporter permease [Planctomycetota bacterium]MDI6787288.1 ABC transporter permease [Planctomycetota bacterium]